jgi:hypothetical protein
LVVGCADSHQVKPDAKYGEIKLASDGMAYVALPLDGRYGHIDYAGSGAMVAQMLQAALLDHLTQVDVGVVRETFPQARRFARNNGYAYLFFTTITHWEDRATEWSSIPDRVALKVFVVDAATEKTISSVSIEGASGLATMGGDHPQDLLPEPIREYVGSLFN